ncbi:hypothetical protein LZI70_19865 (plasmid) [Vibrio pelagius]|uniref:DUF4156 domain-containing protein n=1 Tax=Vibrio pelagius TaxID=28169 RepID=A0ABY5GAP6_VIBPE|nr:hypothetical protein [Vibrio pelagius]UTT87280.1 hypothetical protein LZI70_19865 [Vibrio pelagius]
MNMIVKSALVMALSGIMLTGCASALNGLSGSFEDQENDYAMTYGTYSIQDGIWYFNTNWDLKNQDMDQKLSDCDKVRQVLKNDLKDESKKMELDVNIIPTQGAAFSCHVSINNEK